MLIVDDIIAAPFKGLLWIVKKISETAKAELEVANGAPPAT